MLPAHNPDAPLSLRGRLLKPGVRWLVHAALHASPVTVKRSKVAALSFTTFKQGGCRISAGQLGGVPTEWVEAKAKPGEGVLHYLHGGGYAVGSPQTHQPITTRLALGAGVKVAALDYRLAPEHPFPAALDDAVSAYQALLAMGTKPSQIVVGGDSAGGNLAIVLALKLRDLGLPQPAALLLFSPWTDMTASGESMQSRAKAELMLSAEFAAEMRGFYAPGRELAEPLLSPLFADLKGLPPQFIQVGGREILLSDALRYHDAARAAGVNSQLQEWRACWHVWQLHGGAMPEADAALAHAAAFVRFSLRKG